MEEIEDIKGMGGEYQITSMGRVISKKRKLKRFITQYIDTEGYYQVALIHKKLRYNFKVHRLVAERYIPNPDNCKVVIHKDGNRLNNNKDNLMWATRATVVHRYLESNPNARKGSNNRNARLNKETVLNIYCAAWLKQKSHREISIMYGICLSYVSAIKNGRAWNHVTKHKGN